MHDSHRFVIEAVDVAIDSILFDYQFSVTDRERLATLLELDMEDLDVAVYDLYEEDLDILRREFGVDFNPGSLLARLRSWRPLDGLPYKVHTGRELAMMLAGSKPLAAFCEEVPESVFEPHVVAGRIVKREHLDEKGRRRWVLYALPRETWRIDAYLLLWATAKRSGWSAGFERFEGSLLGYEDWQNDVFMETLYRDGLRRYEEIVQDR